MGQRPSGPREDPRSGRGRQVGRAMRHNDHRRRTLSVRRCSMRPSRLPAIRPAPDDLPLGDEGVSCGLALVLAGVVIGMIVGSAFGARWGLGGMIGGCFAGANLGALYGGIFVALVPERRAAQRASLVPFPPKPPGSDADDPR